MNSSENTHWLLLLRRLLTPLGARHRGDGLGRPPRGRGGRGRRLWPVYAVRRRQVLLAVPASNKKMPHSRDTHI